jgi:hypothetical protein
MGQPHARVENKPRKAEFGHQKITYNLASDVEHYIEMPLSILEKF